MAIDPTEVVEWWIYRITSPSGKVYIGITSNMNNRMSVYRSEFSQSKSKQTLIYNSIKKYGFPAHELKIIDRFNGNNSQAKSKEMFWIKTYMSNCIKYPEIKGLNLTDGGQGTIGYKATDELKKRLSEYHKANPSRGRLGKKVSAESIAKGQATRIKNLKSNGLYTPPKIKVKANKEETRLKQSLAKKGKAAWNKGIPMLPHVKEALMLANKNNPPRKVINDYSSLTKEERCDKFGKHNVGNTYNKGGKHSAEIVEARAANLRGKSNTALNKKIVRYNKRGGN